MLNLYLLKQNSNDSDEYILQITLISQSFFQFLVHNLPFHNKYIWQRQNLMMSLKAVVVYTWYYNKIENRINQTKTLQIIFFKYFLWYLPFKMRSWNICKNAKKTKDFNLNHRCHNLK